MNQQTQDAITDLAKQHGWSELHTDMLREACTDVCPARVRFYVSRAPVGLAPNNVECPVHGQRLCNALERRKPPVSIEDVFQVVTSNVEEVGDYQLRLARLAALEAHLARLRKEAESIRVLDLPLWYCEVGRVWDGYWRDRGGYVLIREDVDQINLDWVKQYLKDDSSSVRDFSREISPDSGCVIKYSNVYRMVEIGNKATPSKKYYIGYLQSYSGTDVRKIISEMKARFGSNTWTERPLDVNGKQYYF